MRSLIRRESGALAALLVVVAVGVRALPALHQSLWLDEVVSARIIGQPTASAAVTQVRRTESSPPGWHLLDWAAWRATGEPRVEDLRILSVVFGGLLAGLTLWYGLSLGLSRLAGFTAGALAALGPNVVAHGAELRPYALLTLLSLLLAIAVQRAATRPTHWNLGVLALIVVVGSYTHYFFLLALAVASGWAFARTRRATQLRLLVTVGAALVPFLVWLPDFRVQYRHDLYAYNGAFNLRTVAYSYARIIGVSGATGGLSALVRLGVTAVVLWGAYLLLRNGDTELAGLMAVAPVALCAVLWLVGPHIFNERNLLIAMPFAALAIGRLVDQASPRPAAGIVLVGAIGVAVIFSLWQWEFNYGRSDYEALARTLVRDGWDPGDEIVQFGPAPLGLSQPLGWYLPGHPVLVNSRSQRCRGPVFAISYDAGAGARWIRLHAVPRTATAFDAFDHTPRGPKAPTPIVVAKIDVPSLSRRAASGLHARLLHVGGSTGLRCEHAMSRLYHPSDGSQRRAPAGNAGAVPRALAGGPLHLRADRILVGAHRP